MTKPYDFPAHYDFPTHDITSDLLRSMKKLQKIVAPMELHCSPADRQFFEDMAEEHKPKTTVIPFGALPIYTDDDLARGHWCSVNSDNTIDVFGKSAERVALKILSQKSYLRIGKLKVK
jgi:hypothetical protein